MRSVKNSHRKNFGTLRNISQPGHIYSKVDFLCNNKKLTSWGPGAFVWFARINMRDAFFQPAFFWIIISWQPNLNLMIHLVGLHAPRIFYEVNIAVSSFKYFNTFNKKFLPILMFQEQNLQRVRLHLIQPGLHNNTSTSLFSNFDKINSCYFQCQEISPDILPQWWLHSSIN